MQAVISVGEATRERLPVHQVIETQQRLIEERQQPGTQQVHRWWKCGIFGEPDTTIYNIFRGILWFIVVNGMEMNYCMK